ncbi:hypothetical protein ABH974_002050 [Bradyrhizobium ottawaense]
MGIDLVRNDQVLPLRTSFWSDCLDLAEAFGWHPQGTTPPLTAHSAHQPNRTYGYTTSDWQRVTDTDAYSMAAALYRAISAHQSGLKVQSNQVSALSRLSRGIDLLKRVAEFVDQGGFEIG